MIVPKSEAKKFIVDWVVRMKDDALAFESIDALMELLYPPASDVLVVPMDKAEFCANLLWQSTLKIMQHGGNELAIAREHKQRDLELGPYLNERDLDFLKQCVLHNVWIIRWLVSHVKENP